MRWLDPLLMINLWTSVFLKRKVLMNRNSPKLPYWDSTVSQTTFSQVAYLWKTEEIKHTSMRSPIQLLTRPSDASLLRSWSLSQSISEDICLHQSHCSYVSIRNAYFLTKFVFDHKFICPKVFLTQTFLWPNFFLSMILFDKKKTFLTKNFFAPTFFGQIFSTKIVWPQ